ncbi:hypothetical protein ANO11243_093820 [Dothideomycetidae sp. 11243]|nr:hypothetical protein ANO11243_093820 [fungal sp. No.11243]
MLGILEFWTVLSIFHQEIILTGVFFTMSLVALGMRLYTKAVLLRKVQWDDWFLVAAQQGRLAASCYPIGMTLVKVSLSILLVRVYQGDHIRKMIVWGISIFVVLSGSLASLVIVATCGLEAYMNPGLIMCSFSHAYYIIGAFWAAGNCASDLALICLSLNVLYSSKMARWSKICTCVLMILGMLTGFVSLGRIIWTNGVPERDWTAAHQTRSIFFIIIELGLGITGLSLSCTRPLLRKWFDKVGIHAPHSTVGRSPSLDFAQGMNDIGAGGGHPNFVIETGMLPQAKLRDYEYV